MSQSAEVYSEDTGVTSSSLSIILTREDNQRSLRCQAENKLIPGSSIQSSLQLEVRFPPRVSLRWGANIDGANIAAGQDIYMECVSSANPPVSRIQWLHDGYRVEASRGQGVLISGLSLVIQVSLYSVPSNTDQKTSPCYRVWLLATLVTTPVWPPTLRVTPCPEFWSSASSSGPCVWSQA